VIVKKDELVDLNKFQDPDSFKTYITKCNWEFLSILANCELAASFGVDYIDFIFFYLFS
jgi:hypothetical protein